MTENFEGDAHDYLLNQMDAARRSAFERELQRNAAARSALKACADAMAEFACTVAAAESLRPADQRAALDAIVAATRPGDAAMGTRRQRRIGWQHIVWPAAAMILLALNFLEFERPFDPRLNRRPSVARDSKAAPAENVPPREDSGTLEPRGAAKSTPATTPSDGLRADAGPASGQAREIERLRDSVAELQRAQQQLRAEYDALLERIVDRAVVDRALNRLTTMELVDAASYARGVRKGLVNVGRGVLTEPGVVVVPEQEPPPLGTTMPAPKQPYAWSVFDEKEQRGYLNLYQLPVLAGDQSMHVWVKPVDATAYQRVGEVPPQFQGRNGSVQYSLPGSTAAPAEILITIEPRGVVPTAPTGPTVLKGP